MSRIGKKPVIIPEGVAIETRSGGVVVTGPKGELSMNIPSGILLEISENKALVKTKNEVKKANYGSVRAELANMLQGVSQGFQRTLEVLGTGYRAAADGRELNLSLGFAHPVVVKAPPGISFAVQANKITVSGIDKKAVGQIAAKIKSIRPPDPYKGKGIRYFGEFIRKKQGKAAKGKDIGGGP